MRRVDGYSTTLSFEVFLERISQALTVVVVGVGHSDFGNATLGNHVCQDLTLTRIGRSGTEEQAIVFSSRQRWGRSGWGNHYNAVWTSNVLQDCTSYTGTVSTHDCSNTASNQTFSSSRSSSRIDTGRVSAYANNGLTTQEQTRSGCFSERDVGSVSHWAGQGFNRAGKAQDYADLYFGSCQRWNGHRYSRKKNFFHLRLLQNGRVFSILRREAEVTHENLIMQSKMQNF